MRWLDRREAIQFTDIAAAVSRECLTDRHDLFSRFHAREDGRLLSGAAAFAAMWRAVPLLRPLGIAARNNFVLACLEKLYDRFLRIRPRLQRFAVKLGRW